MNRNSLRSRFLPPRWPLLLVLASAPLGLGCGGAGPERFELSGKVSFQCQPAPGGQIVFTPLEGGPGSVAMIRHGAYRTFPGKGVLGGRYRVAITSLTAPTDGSVPEDQLSALRSPYQTEIELPHQAATYDFKLPADDR